MHMLSNWNCYFNHYTMAKIQTKVIKKWYRNATVDGSLSISCNLKRCAYPGGNDMTLWVYSVISGTLCIGKVKFLGKVCILCHWRLFTLKYYFLLLSGGSTTVCYWSFINNMYRFTGSPMYAHLSWCLYFSLDDSIHLLTLTGP